MGFIGCAGCVNLTNQSLLALGARLSQLTAVESLELRFQGVKSIGDDGAVALADAISKLRLVDLTLDFQGCKIRDVGSRAILDAVAAHVPELQTLKLTGLNLGMK